MTDIGYIHLDSKVPFNDERVDEFYNDVKSITDKYNGEILREETIIRLEHDLHNLLSQEKYYGCVIKGNDFYREEEWSLEKLLSIYSKEYPNRFDSNKKEYTNMEINNILFDLNLKGVIEGYHSPAIPYDIPFHNNKVFTKKWIKVEIPIINIGDESICEQIALSECLKEEVKND